MLGLADRAYKGLFDVGARKPASYDVVPPTSEALVDLSSMQVVGMPVVAHSNL